MGAKNLLAQEGPADLSFFIEGNGYWYDDSSLMRAASAGAADVTALLLEHKVAIVKQNRSGMSALHMACGNDFMEVSLLIVGNGGDPMLQDSCGRSPLDGVGRNIRLPHRVPLSYTVKQQRRDLLVAERQDYLRRMELSKRRNDNWA